VRNAFDILVRDLRAGLRAHARAPMVTALAVGVLALGIAAAAISLSVVDSFFVRQLPIADSDRFVHVYQLSTAGEPFPISFPEYEDVRALTHVFDTATAEAPAPLMVSIGQLPPDRLWGDFVSGDYFRALGVPAAVGRLFTTGEDAIVISDGLWKRRFGSSAALLGTTMTIEGRPFRIVGVAPEIFRGTIVGFSPDLWVPLQSPSIRSADSPVRDDADNRDEHNYFVMARLAPGIGLDQAKTALADLGARLDREVPATSTRTRLSPMTQSQGRFPTVRDTVFGFSMLTVAIGVMVTLIACANIAGVLLVRASARRTEVSVRLALGASRSRIVCHLLAESASIALAAGALGVVIAWQATKLLSGIKVIVARGASAGVDVTLDGRVIAVCGLMIMTTALLCGITPALESMKTDLLQGLRGGRTGRGCGSSVSRRLLLAAQIAVSMVLLGTGGLFLRSLQAARHADLGFDPERVATAAVDIRVRGAVGTADPFWTRLLDDVRALPDTESAGMTWRLPLWLGRTRSAVAPATSIPTPGQEWPDTEFSTISPGYLHTVGIPLLEGRDFTPRDRSDAPPVVIVNDVLAERFWPGRSAIGELLVTPDNRRFEVVGVARRSKYFSIGEPPTSYAYFPLGQQSPRTMTVVARSVSGRSSYGEDIRAIVNRLDPQAIVDLAMLDDRVRMAMAPAAGSASAIGIVSVLAVLLTALGLFGAVAQTVGRRTYEIGVRRALGARDRSVAALVMADTLVLVGWGLAAGVLAALAASQPLRTVLYDVNPADPMVFAIAPALMLGICLLAIAVPTYRALRINPATALRHE
jgi:predicted permease